MYGATSSSFPGDLRFRSWLRYMCTGTYVRTCRQEVKSFILHNLVIRKLKNTEMHVCTCTCINKINVCYMYCTKLIQLGRQKEKYNIFFYLYLNTLYMFVLYLLYCVPVHLYVYMCTCMCVYHLCGNLQVRITR